jgi:hypothetical protein
MARRIAAVRTLNTELTRLAHRHAAVVTDVHTTFCVQL